MKRRHFILAGGLLSAGAYINSRGLRYPRLSFEPPNPSLNHSLNSIELNLDELVIVNKSASESASSKAINLRAIAPEPKLHLHTKQADNGKTFFNINNIAANAILRVDAPSGTIIDEQVSGINRTIEITLKAEQRVSLEWFLAEREEISFAAIGDSGGGSELNWCIERAVELNANFILHLGDFNYGDDEYDLAIEQFYNSPIPVYVSIGNHDFNDSGLVYQQFLNQIGPMNHSFMVADTRFINIDTAVNFFPAYSGNRGDLFDQLVTNNISATDHVVFTHKPFVDSREGQDHDISGVGEKTWLNKSMHRLGASNLLCGHVHHSSERDYHGIHQWTAGEGLGHEDLVHKKLVSKILIGNVVAGEKVNYHWRDLNMPWAYHRSHTHETKLRNYKRFEQLEWHQQTQDNLRKAEKG